MSLIWPGTGNIFFLSAQNSKRTIAVLKAGGKGGGGGVSNNDIMNLYDATTIKYSEVLYVKKNPVKLIITRTIIKKFLCYAKI